MAATAAGPSASIPPQGADTLTPTVDPISIGSALYTENLSGYFGVTGQFGTAAPSSELTALVQHTPINVIRFGDDMDSTNLTAGVSYSSSGVAGSLQINVVNDWNFCESLTPKCTFIAELPGETNSTGDVLSAITYLHSHGINAAYYDIGNEPMLWSHFDIPWTSWSSSDHSTPTAMQYAQEVQRMIPVIRSVVPGAKIIGLEDDQCSNDNYVKDVALLDGPSVSAIACHAYPASGIDKAGAGLQQAYNTLLASNANFARNVPRVRSAISAECPTCTIPVWVDEFNLVAGKDPADFSAYMVGYPDFVFTAGNAVLGLTVNLTQYLYFALWPNGGLGNYGMITPSYAVRPSYYWYSYFAPNITSGKLYSVTYAPTYTPSFATYLQGSTGSLLVVNANASNAETVSVSLPLSLANGGKTIYWDGTTPTPTVTAYSSLPETYTLAPASVLLVDVNAGMEGLPSPPQGLTATTYSTSQINLAWTNPAGTLTDNHVYEYGAGCSSLLNSFDLGGVYASFSATGLSASTTYCFTVTASSSAGQSPPSEPASATTTDGLPSAPTGLTAGAVSTTEVNLTWTNPSGPLTDNHVYWGTSCGSLTSLSVGSVVTNFTKTGLSPSTSYCFAVTASNSVGESPQSAATSATTVANPPSAPTGLTAAAVSATEINLAWTNPSGPLTDSHVYWGTSCGSLTSLSVGSAVTTYTKIGLSPSTSYCFEVSASTSGGEGPLSSSANATTSSYPGGGGGLGNGVDNGSGIGPGAGPASPGPAVGLNLVLQWLTLGFLAPVIGTSGLLVLRIAFAADLVVALVVLVSWPRATTWRWPRTSD